MSAQDVVQDLSFPVKVYVGIVHLLLLFLVILFLQRPRKNGDKATKKGKSRMLTKDDRAVTIESCEWINSTLAWFYLHAQSNEHKDRTPHIVKLWLRALNKQLLKDKKKDQRIVIESLSPDCLPPKLTSVYCLCVSGNMQCITFHVESSDLGFLVRVLQQTDNGPKTTHVETRVVKLTGEVALKLSTAPSRLEVSVQFIGVPEIAMATKCLGKDSEVDGAEVQEKVKEVICKTITSIPLTADATSRERLSSDAGSATSKEGLDSPSSISCVGEEGKLLVKVIKATGLNGKDKSGTISPYCIVSTSSPLQRKRTSMVRDNDSPFWNEYFTFDITPKTKEISLDIYDYEKTEKDCNGHLDDCELTEEQDDYLGQVIVPLSTVNRDQTCRLILPVLPKSSKSEHSKGDISLEFTFDKDGKVIDATLPVVSGFERNILPNDTEKPSAQSTPSEESPSVFVNGVGSGVVNGHVLVRKRYIESSLDELAMEIEDYEQGEGRPDTHCNGARKEEDVPELHAEPELPPVVIATEEAGPSRETEHKEDESEMAIVELLKLSGEEVPEESKEEKKEIEDETGEKLEEGEEEEKELKENEEEEQVAKEPEEKTEEPSLKPKHRRSFNFRFKKKKTDKKAEKEEEMVEERHDPDEETQEGDKKEEIPVEDNEDQKESQEEELNVQEEKEGEENKAEEETEKIEQAAELEPKPKLRRSFFKRRPRSMAAADKKTDDDSEEKVFSRNDPVRHSYHAGDRPALEPSNLREVQAQEEKEDEENEAKEEAEKIEHASELEPKPKLRRPFFKKRPQSMAAADKRTDGDSEEKVLSRHDPVRHSYHAGDRPALEPSNLRKSTSQSSLLSYSPNPHSSLVLETISKGQKKYQHIPPVMAKRRAYEKGGIKLHIYNDHIFQAVHFTGSSPDCAVCGKTIKGKVGKQGYQCRGCKMVTHRDCHYDTTEMCTSDEVKKMDIEYVGDSEV